MSKLIAIRIPEELAKDVEATNKFITAEISKHGAYMPKSVSAVPGYLGTMLYVLVDYVEPFPSYPGVLPQWIPPGQPINPLSPSDYPFAIPVTTTGTKLVQQPPATSDKITSLFSTGSTTDWIGGATKLRIFNELMGE